MDILLYTVPHPVVTTTHVTLATYATRLFAIANVGVPKQWLAQSLWSVFSFLIRWPSSWFFSDYELVARFYEDITSVPSVHGFGIPIYFPRVVSCDVLEYIGHVGGSALHTIQNCFLRNGDHMTLFWDTPLNRWNCLSTVYVQEPIQWPPTQQGGPCRTTRKTALGTLVFHGKTRIEVSHVKMCLGPHLHGHQDAWIPLPLESDSKYLSVLHQVSLDKMSISRVIRENGLTLSHREMTVSPSGVPKHIQLLWTCSSRIAVPDEPDTFLMLVCQVIHRKKRYMFVLVKPRSIQLVPETLTGDSDYMSMAEGNLDFFYLASRSMDNTLSIRTYSWAMIRQCASLDVRQEM